METLGKRQIRRTMNTYRYVLPELLRKASDRMDDLLSGSG
jgi:hypothetical protein